MDNLCLSWHGNLVSCSNHWARATAAVYVSGPKPVRSSLWLSFHFTFGLGKNPLKWKKTHNSYWSVTPTRYFWHGDTHSPLHLVWYRIKASTHEHNFFHISPFQMLSSCWEKNPKSHKMFHQTVLLFSSSFASSSPFTQSHPSTDMKYPFLLPTHREFHGQLLPASILNQGLIERFIPEQTSESFTGCV